MVNFRNQLLDVQQRLISSYAFLESALDPGVDPVNL